MMAIVTGVVCVAFGLARLGFIVDLLSKPIRYGYMNGIALTIFLSQLPKLLGFSVSEHEPLRRIVAIGRAIAAGETNLVAFAVGASALVLILVLKRRLRVPGILFAVVAATLVVALLDLSRRAGVSVLGPLPQGLPLPKLPLVDPLTLSQIVMGSLAVALVAFADTSVLSRVYAAKLGTRVDPNQEMVGLGAANIAAGLFQGFPISSSSSRTPVAEAAGAKTQMTGVVGALAIALLLVLAIVNVANLVLVRARVRLKELATRLALGASPGQVARQLVLENLLLTMVAAAVGLLVGAAALHTLGTFNLEDLPYGSEIRLDGVAVLYASLLALGIGLVMGLLPVATVLSANLTAVLHDEGRGSTGGGGARAVRRALVVAQVAFTFVLLVGAGLLLASFRKVLDVDPGFVAERVVTGSIVLPRTRYADDNARRTFTDEALRRVRAIAGVVEAGATDVIPMGGNSNDSVILAEGYQMKPGESVISPANADVTPGYFEAMGVKLVKGRFFAESDGAGKLPVLIVDEKLARRFWPDQDPIGRRMYRPTDINNLTAVNDKTVFLTIVGVVRDVKLQDLTEGGKAVGTYYYPMAQDASTFLTFAVKTAGNGDSVTAALRSAIASLDPELPLFDAQSMQQRLGASLLNRRSPAMLSLSFGILALLLSAVGIYGVLAYLVTQRTKEIGIRIALGSSARAIFDLVIREGLLLVGAGFLLGGVGAFVLRGSLESQLFGISAADPLVVGGVTLLLALVALVACTVPARRATRIDPRIALTE
jgi:predicted permease